MISSAPAVAAQLCEWFESIQHLANVGVFSIVPEGPHRDAVVLDVLRRNARVLLDSELDRKGKLYSPSCLFLAAASRKLGATLGVGHWRAALDNVVQLQAQFGQHETQSAVVGLEIGSPAEVFKQQLDEAITQAGLLGPINYLDRQSRDIALGLAVNWGMRFLLAYSLYTVPPRSRSKRKDLPWIAGLVDSVLAQTNRRKRA